jgi:Domain of unknown function (DUF929)
VSSGKPSPTRRKPAQRPAANTTKRPASRATPARDASERRKAAQQQPGAARRVSAQQRLAAERQAAAAAREAAERRRKVMLAFIPVITVLVVVAAFVLVKVVGGWTPKSGKKSQAAAAAVIKDVTTVPMSAANTVGAGTVSAIPKAINGEAITADGKPRVLYIGAEYCPFCAAERWAVAVALSRFGTLSGLGQTASAPSPESYPNTNTLSFHGASLTSSTISFSGFETATNQVKDGSYTKLDSLSSADKALRDKYDAPPYVSKDDAGAIPFVLIGGKYLIVGASYDPAVLQGKTHAQIAAALKDPTTAISKAVLGTANVITAAICSLTGKKPAAVCSAPGVVAGQKKLTGAK